VIPLSEPRLVQCFFVPHLFEFFKVKISQMLLSKLASVYQITLRNVSALETALALYMPTMGSAYGGPQ